MESEGDFMQPKSPQNTRNTLMGWEEIAITPDQVVSLFSDRNFGPCSWMHASVLLRVVCVVCGGVKSCV